MYGDDADLDFLDTIKKAMVKLVFRDFRDNKKAGKMSSAEAQREKKDVTGNTRNTITTALANVLPQLVSAICKTYDNMLKRPIGEYEVKVSFGEYGAPDFDSRVETIGKAASYGVMSTETQVEELWGSSKTDTWKAAEVQRVKAEKGLEVGGDTSVGDEL